MDEQSKIAFSYVSDICKQVLTLSTGILALEITFTKDIVHHPTNLEIWLLEASWLLFGVSVVGGLLTLMAIAGTIGTQISPQPGAIYERNVKLPFLVQFFTFLLAIVLSVVYGVHGLSRPHP